MKRQENTSKMKEVRQIPYEQATPWFLFKHYAKRVPSISFAFGLYIDSELCGVVSYGMPASPSLVKGICGKEYADKVLELNRLVIEENSPKNSASFLIGQSFKLLPKPKIIVSYADTSKGHLGYVYQATNFIYTGLSDAHNNYEIEGSNKHSRHLHKGENGVIITERPRKHRYIYFIGNKTETKNMKKLLKYKSEPFPKGETQRYYTGKKLATQSFLI